MRFDTAHNTLSPCFFKVLLTVLFLAAGLCLHTPAHAHPSAAAHDNETPYAVLADMLENPQTRDKLIQQLRAIAPQTETPQPGPAQAGAPSGSGASAQTQASGHIPVVQQLAWTLRHTSHGLTSDLSSAATAIESMARGRLPSGTAVQARYVMDGIGLDIERDFEAIYPERFTDGPPMVMERRAAALWGSGYRWPGFVELANQPGGVRFVVPTAEEIAQIRAKHPFLAQLTVPPGLYPGQYDPIVTVGAWSSSGRRV